MLAQSGGISAGWWWKGGVVCQSVDLRDLKGFEKVRKSFVGLWGDGGPFCTDIAT